MDAVAMEGDLDMGSEAVAMDMEEERSSGGAFSLFREISPPTFPFPPVPVPPALFEVDPCPERGGTNSTVFIVSGTRGSKMCIPSFFSKNRSAADSTNG